MTPLHWAVEANSFDICLLLLKAGVRTDMKNKVRVILIIITALEVYKLILPLQGCRRALKNLEKLRTRVYFA